MAEDVGALVARVVADTEQFRSEMTRVANQLSTNTAKMNSALARVSSHTSALRSSLSLLTRGLAALGVAFSVRALVDFTNRTLTAAEHLNDLSKRLNVSVESLSELQYVAKIANVDFDNLTTSVQFMARTFGEAERGSTAARSAIAALGLDFRALSQVPIDQQLQAVAGALVDVQNESTRAALATQIFGRSGAQMLQITNLGAEGIRKLVQEAHDLGLVLSTEDAEAAAEAKEAIDKLMVSFVALGRALAIEVAPAITSVAEALRRLIAPTDAEALQGRIDNVARTIQSIRDLGTFPYIDLGQEAFDVAMKRRQDALDALIEKLRLLKLEQQDLEFAKPIAGTAAGGGGAGGRGIDAGGGLFGSPLSEASVPIAALLQKMPDFQSTFDALTKANAEAAEQTEDAWIDAWNVSRDQAWEASQSIVEAQRFAVDSGIGFLQALGAEHRGAAIAALAIEKALAIQQVFVASQAAQMRAMSDLGPIAGAPVAAGIAVRARISMGLIAATGLVQALQISHGGTQSTRGTSANPISTTGTAGSTASTAVRGSQRVVEIHINGNVIGQNGITELAKQLRDVIDGADVVLFGPNSRQATVIRP